MTGDHHVVGLGLGHTGSNRADTDLGHQLDGDIRHRVGVLQVVDQLGQILDRVDVVVRRGRNQADARHRVTQEADVLGHLVAGQLTAFAGLGALGHLDLDLVGVDQVFGGDTEAAGRHLLDRRAQAVAGLQLQITLDTAGADDLGQHGRLVDRDEALRIFAAFTGVRRPPIRFIATASVVCASVEMEPSDMAPVAKRLTISLAGSTSSSATGAPAGLSSNRPRRVMWRLL
jgi:hypothetical protein